MRRSAVRFDALIRNGRVTCGVAQFVLLQILIGQFITELRRRHFWRGSLLRV
jgi:uncharacterized membrane protein YwzB